MKEVIRKRVGKKGAGQARRQLRRVARVIESLFEAQAEPLPVLHCMLARP